MIPDDALAAILARARLAPSADNCQPFVFWGDARNLEIRWVASRAAHAIDRARYASWLTLGALLETLRLAAGAAGASVVSEELDLRAGDGAAWARLRLRLGDGFDPLHGAIEQRCTDRRLYRRVTINSSLNDMLTRVDGIGPRAAVSLRERLPSEALRWLLDADAYVWCQPEVTRDIQKWIRRSPGELVALGDGIGPDAFGLPAAGVRFIHLPGAARLIPAARLHLLHRQWVRALLASSSATVLIHTSNPGPEALVDAGRRAVRIWLTATRVGLAAQPMTILSLPVYARATGALPPETQPRFVEHYTRGLGVLRAAYGLPDDALPVWIFRLGAPPDAPPPRSPRLPLAAIWTPRGGPV